MASVGAHLPLACFAPLPSTGGRALDSALLTIALTALHEGSLERTVRCAIAALVTAPPAHAGTVLSHALDLYEHERDHLLEEELSSSAAALGGGAAERGGGGGGGAAHSQRAQRLHALLHALSTISRGAAAAVRATLVRRRRFARAALAISVEVSPPASLVRLSERVRIESASSSVSSS